MNVLLDEDQIFNRMRNRLLELLYRFLFPLGNEPGHAGSKAQQLEQRLKCGQVPISWLLDVLELDQISHISSGKLRQSGSVELLAGNGQHQIAGINQDGQNDNGPFGLEPQCLRSKVFDVENVLNQLRSIDHLTVTFLFEQVENMFGIFGSIRVEPFAIEQLQTVKNGNGLFGAVLAGDGPQCVLRGLGPVLAGDEHRKTGILRRLFLEVCGQTDACHRVHQVTEIDPLVGGNSGQISY